MRRQNSFLKKEVEVKFPGESGVFVLTSRGNRVWERLELFCIVEGEKLGALREHGKKAGKSQDRKGKGDRSQQNDVTRHAIIPF